MKGYKKFKIFTKTPDKMQKNYLLSERYFIEIKKNFKKMSKIFFVNTAIYIEGFKIKCPLFKF